MEPTISKLKVICSLERSIESALKGTRFSDVEISDCVNLIMNYLIPSTHVQSDIGI